MILSILYFGGMSLIQLIPGILILFTAITPALFLLSALLLHISLNARNIHESRSIESVFFLIFSVLIVSVAFIDLENDLLLQFIPFVNSVLIIQQFNISGSGLFYMLLSCLIPTLILLKINIRKIHEDQVLNSNTINPDKTQSPVLPLLISFVIFILLIRFGQTRITSEYSYGILFSQLIFFFIPAIILISMKKGGKRFHLFRNVPDIRVFLLTSFITVLLFVVVNYYQQFINMLFSRPEIPESTKSPQNTIWFSLFLVCLVPAIAEEFFFRAYLLGTYIRENNSKGILISAIIFALFHQNYQEFFGLLILGLWFAYMVFNHQSVWPAVVCHFINNAMVVIVSRYHLNFHTMHSAGIISFVLLVLLFKKYQAQVYTLFDKKQEGQA